MSMHIARAIAFLLVAATLSGCPGGKSNVIQSISLAPGQTLALGTPLNFLIKGTGAGYLIIDWGDGTTEEKYVDLTAPSLIPHTFTVWKGGKTVTAIGKPGGTLGYSGTVGRASTRFTIPPGFISVGFGQPGNAGAKTCYSLPSPFNAKLVLPSLVHITTLPTERGDLINFGCPFDGCRYNADGKPGSVAAAPFPFPGLREYSMVLRVGTQLVQGGTDVRFTPTQSQSLEICLNDDNLTRNHTGGYELHITVDQLGPPATP